MNRKNNVLISRKLPLEGLRQGVFLLALALSLTSLPPKATAQHSFIAIGAGSSSGVYFQIGNMICHTLNKETAEGSNHNIRCIPLTSDGSVDNINMLVTGRIDFAVVQSDVLHHAYKGESNFAGADFKNLRMVLSLHSEPFHILARKGSGITVWGDLKGRNVNIGSAGSGIRATFDELMGAFHIDTAFFGRTTELNSIEQVQALCKGRIDAYGYTVGVPNASVRRAIQECGATLIPLDTSTVSKLAAERSYFDYVTIRAGSYPNIRTDVHTLGVIATVVTTADKDESIVYELVRSVFENIDHIREIHPAFYDLDPHKMACRGHSAPLHDAARKYYSEHGLDVCP